MRSTHRPEIGSRPSRGLTEASASETAGIVRITVVVDHRVVGSGQERTQPPNDQRSDRERGNGRNSRFPDTYAGATPLPTNAAPASDQTAYDGAQTNKDDERRSCASMSPQGRRAPDCARPDATGGPPDRPLGGAFHCSDRGCGRWRRRPGPPRASARWCTQRRRPGIRSLRPSIPWRLDRYRRAADRSLGCGCRR